MLPDPDSTYETARLRALVFKILQLLSLATLIRVIKLLYSLLVSGVASFKYVIDFYQQQPIVKTRCLRCRCLDRGAVSSCICHKGF